METFRDGKLIPQVSRNRRTMEAHRPWAIYTQRQEAVLDMVIDEDDFEVTHEQVRGKTGFDVTWTITIRVKKEYDNA